MSVNATTTFRQRAAGQVALEILLVACLYYAAARLGLILALRNTNATPVWPPSGIALAAALLVGRHALGGVLLGAFAANVVVFLQNHAAAPPAVLLVSAAIASGNALEALAGSALLRRFAGAARCFERAQDAFKFVGIAFAMCLVSALLGPTALLVSGLVPPGLFPAVACTWWLGDTAGVLVIAPLVLSWKSERRTKWSRGRILEASLVAGLLFVAGAAAFRDWRFSPGTSYPLVLAILPMLGWVALRFSLREATVSVALISAMAIAYTVRGSGPFAVRDVNESLVLVQAFIGIATVTILAMASLVAERERAQRELETRVRQQAAIASLGRQALAGGGLDAFLRDAAAWTARTLGNELCGILATPPGREGLVLRAEYGWRPDAGGRVIETGAGTLADYILASDSPAIIPDLSGRNSFEVPEALRAQRIASGMGAVIAGEAGGAPGVLFTGSVQRRTFTQDDVNFLQSVAHLLAETIRRRKVEEELARSNAELEQFAYAASHDLQEPLRTIAGYTQLLQRRYRDRLDADANDFIELAVDAAARMRTLIQALLAYSRIGGRETSIRPLNTEHLLAQAVSNLAAAIADKQAEVTHDGLIPVLGDETMLVQLFQNLLANAIKFSGGRRPAVHVSSRRDGGEAVFTVQDNGIGIDPQHLGAIFNIFRRLHTADEYPGAGVGLAVCKKIVQRHGGKIWAESTRGEGSAFHFTLPAADAAFERTS